MVGDSGTLGRSGIVCALSVEAAPELHEIEFECNRPPWTLQLIVNEFSNPHAKIWGVRSSGRIAGFLIMHVILDEAHILSFGVRASFRGEGMGKKLLQEALSQLLEECVRVVTLEVRAENQIALGLYRSLGFEQVGIRPRYYRDNDEDAYILRLDMGTYSAAIQRKSADSD